MRIWTRLRAMGVASLFVAAVPFLAAAHPAGATPSATAHADLTFVNQAGNSVTCQVYLTAHRDAEAKTASADVTDVSISGDTTSCSFQPTIDITLAYKDEQGVMRTARSSSYAALQASLDADHVGSNVRATASLTFYDCDASQSAACSVSTTAAPK